MKIQISHLKEGFHKLTVSEAPEKLGLSDAAAFKNKVDVSLEFDKQHDALYVKLVAKTVSMLTCDRCTELFAYELSSAERIVYTSDRKLIQYDEELRYLAADQQEIDITEDVRDAILLSIPVKKLCKEDCKGICPQCGKNLNIGRCNCVTTQVDSRWDALKKLKS